MKVPRKLMITGDVEAGKAIIGQGNQQLAILENQMSFQKLKQGTRHIEYHDGTTIDVWSCFSLHGIYIHVPPAGGEEKPKERVCFANTGMAIGRIIRVVDLIPADETLPSTIEDTVSVVFITYNTYPENYYCTKDILYDVQVCNGTDYLLYQNMKSTDFCRHKPGELVMLVLTRVDDVPTAVLDDNVTFPCSKPAFPNRVMAYGEETIAIIPLETGLPQYEFV